MGLDGIYPTKSMIYPTKSMTTRTSYPYLKSSALFQSDTHDWVPLTYQPHLLDIPVSGEAESSMPILARKKYELNSEAFDKKGRPLHGDIFISGFAGSVPLKGKAVCHRDIPDSSDEQHDNRVPDHRCGCGWYGFFIGTDFENRDSGVEVVAQHYGKVVEHEYGIRSEWQEILNINLPSRKCGVCSCDVEFLLSYKYGAMMATCGRCTYYTYNRNYDSPNLVIPLEEFESVLPIVFKEDDK